MTRAYGFTSRLTTAPAATKAYSPIVVPHTIVQLAPMLAPRFTRVRRYSFLRTIWLRGLMTLVNTMEGPQKTSSSNSTPVYSETLFWILTLFPMRTLFDTRTFWPRLQRSPIVLLAMMWLNCYILVTVNISQDSSMIALGCAYYYM